MHINITGADRLREHWDKHGCDTFNTSTCKYILCLRFIQYQCDITI